MTLEESRARLSAIEDELTEIVSKLDAPADDTEELEKRSSELMEERQEILAEIEKAETKIKEEKRAMKEVIANKTVKEIEKKEDDKMDMEIRNTPEYINAYAEYIKTGKAEECRALTSTNDTTPNGTGTVAIPDMVYDIVKTAWNREGIMSRVRKSYLKGNLKVGFEISGTDAAIHAEGASAVSEETLVLGTVTLTPQSIKKWISISDEVLDLRGEAFLNYIYDELAYRIAKKAADQLVAKIQACGTVSTTTSVAVPKLTATTAALGDIAQAMALLSDEAANPVIMMNKATWGTYKALAAAGNYGYDPFEGLDVVFNNTITAYNAATTGVTYAIVGDLDQGALANFPNGDGIEFKFDELTDMTKDLVRVLGREYVGLGIVAPNAFVKITK